MSDRYEFSLSSSSCPVLSLPPELHLRIFSYLPSIEDQVSTSLVCTFWNTLLSTSITAQKTRYSSNTPHEQIRFKHSGIHSLLRPDHSWLGCKIRNGAVTSISFHRFARRWTPHGQYIYSGSIDPLVSIHSNFHISPQFSDTQRCKPTCERLFADLTQPSIYTMDISPCGFLDEPFLSPYIPHDATLNSTDIFEDVKNDGFPVCLHRRKTHLVQCSFRTLRLTTPEADVRKLTFRQLLSTIVAQIGGILTAEGMSAADEHELLFDQCSLFGGIMSDIDPGWGIKVILPTECPAIEPEGTSTVTSTVNPRKVEMYNMGRYKRLRVKRTGRLRPEANGYREGGF
ncbi:hypothetical protein TWF696_007866 [Orbilia brochopaga]|uniref:F-box domain-containing protein n=1 Tax=Orbilia brochopaga TaxID=3140254 RepID=A0AAV9UM72_9PEZI